MMRNDIIIVLWNLSDISHISFSMDVYLYLKKEIVYA